MQRLNIIMAFGNTVFVVCTTQSRMHCIIILPQYHYCK